MAQWNNSESGILRRTKPKENFDDLLVFGYACKLFKDDEKALYIDQGKHLIPWMGDDKLKIDRYDCRGALSDLRTYEASREGFDAMRWLGLSDSDRKLEELCDNERYYSLHINEEEEEMYKEEEQKRQKTNAFQYSYDVPAENQDNQEGIPNVPEQEEEEEPYVPSPVLDVPVDIAIPKTVKENARIEKTAMFVSKQGPQMEILIKAKQGDNPQFSFLNQGDTLYKFYRHVLSAFKSGRYQGHAPVTSEEKHDENPDHDSSGHYLHPSLVSTSFQSEIQTSSVSIPTVPYKPSANCAYSQLVNRIQGNQTEVLAPEVQKPPENPAQMTVEQQQYYQYYYTAQYYEYYKQMAQYQQACAAGENQGQMMAPPDFQLDPNMQAYFQQVAYAQYMQHHHQQQQHHQGGPNNNSYAQIVSNVNKDVSNPYAALMPNLPQSAAPPETPTPETSAMIPQKTNSLPTAALETREVKIEREPTKEVTAQQPLSFLAQYGSGSEDESEEEQKEEERREVYKVPLGEIQIVIDKMAIYVSKNGEQFEEIVKAKGDTRFDFLHDGHEYNKYYREKIKELKNVGKRGAVKVTEEEVKNEKENGISTKIKEKKVIAPVSFSIKKPKEDQPKEIKSALPVEESDDEETENTETKPASTSVTPPSSTPSSVTSPPSTTPTNPTLVTMLINSMQSVANSAPEKVATSDKTEVKEYAEPKNGIIDVDDPILEMIDLTDELEERKDARRAEDKIKDKLAAAAREKLASVTRDKALQLERKRKAAAFLKLKSVETTNSTSVNTATATSQSKEKSKEKETSTTACKSFSSNRVSPVPEVREKVSEKSKHRHRSRSREKSRHSEKDKRSNTPKGQEASDSEDGEIKKRKKSSKKKKSHKRKHSRTRHDSKSKKKSKKRHKRSDSCSSGSVSSS